MANDKSLLGNIWGELMDTIYPYLVLLGEEREPLLLGVQVVDQSRPSVPLLVTVDNVAAAAKDLSSPKQPSQSSRCNKINCV